MKTIFSKVVYWIAPILSMVIYSGIFWILDLLFRNNSERKDIGSVLPNILLYITMGMVIGVGYLICVIYKALKYRMSILIIISSLFLGMGIWFHLGPNFAFPKEINALEFILALLEIILFWMAYPLTLCTLLYFAGKRENNDNPENPKRIKPTDHERSL